MKKTAILFAVAAMIGCNNAGNDQANDKPKADSPAVAAEPKKETPPPPPAMDSAAKMKAYQDYMTPGEEQKMIASWNGKWTSVGKYWMDEKAPPTETRGSVENKMVLGGLHQESVHRGNMMGMPFEGHGTMSFDNHKKVFQSSWMDNMGSGEMHMEGTWDAATKTLNMKGDCNDPVMGKTDVRQVIKIIDDKNMTMEMYGTPASTGKEMKWMEMKITRS